MSGLLLAGLVAAGLIAASRRKKASKSPAEEAKEAYEQNPQIKSATVRGADGLLRFTLVGTTRVLQTIGQYHVVLERMDEGLASVLRVVPSPRNESNPLVKVLDQIEEADPKTGLYALISAQAGDVGIVPGTTFVVISTWAGLQHYTSQGFAILIEPGGKAAFTHDVPGMQPPPPPPMGTPFPASPPYQQPPAASPPYQQPPPYAPPPYQPPAQPPYQPPPQPVPPAAPPAYQPPAAPPAYQPPAAPPPYAPPPYQPPAQPPYQPPQPAQPPYQPPPQPAQPPYQPPPQPAQPQPVPEPDSDENEDVPDAIAALPESIRDKVMEVLSAEPEASPAEMEAVAKLLDKAGHKKAASEVRKISKGRIIVQQFDGTILTIRDGWNPSYLAKYYTGDPNRWKELIASNYPKMHLNDKGQLVPFNSGDTIKVPLSWNAASKKPPPPIYGKTKKPGVFDAIFGKQPAPTQAQKADPGIIDSIKEGVQKWISP